MILLYFLYFLLQSFYRIGVFFTQIFQYASILAQKIVFYKKYILAGLSFGAAILLFINVLSFLKTVPHPRELADFHQPRSVMIYDRNNLLLYSTYSYKQGLLTEIEELPKILIEATLANESQITQQLAKKVLKAQDRTIQNKIKEEIVVWRIERGLSQEQILKLYFNTISYGEDAVGVKSASLRFFNKKLGELTDKEAVALTALADGSTRESEIKNILNRLEKKRIITAEEKSRIEKEKLIIQPPIVYKRAPHAVDYILQELERKSGDSFRKKDVIVHATIDLSLQNYIQQVVLQVATQQKDNSSNIAVLAVDNETGEILSMVGSINYFNSQAGRINIIRGRQSLDSLHIFTSNKKELPAKPVIKVWVDSPDNNEEYEGTIASLISSEITEGIENGAFYSSNANKSLLVESLDN